MKKLVVLLIFLSAVLSFLSAITPEGLMALSSESLLRALEARGLSTDGDEGELRERLASYEGIVMEEARVTDDAGEAAKSGYTLTIRKAGGLGTDEGRVKLTGGVVISFSDSGGKEKTLSASTVIVDTAESRLTALGGASYRDSAGDAAIQEMDADIFTLMWEKGDLLITGGQIRTERKNSEEKSVSFYTEGETLSYISPGTIVFDSGLITSNPLSRLSSIAAGRIALLPGSDMILSNAFFRIGRVPVFYLPFFFYPGSRILSNPSFGLSSTKGAFLNTTTEIFGSYPGIKDSDETSSFSSLLKATDDTSSLRPDGFYYSSDGTKGELESWAEKSGSYLAVLADAYKGMSSSILPLGGIYLGFDSEIRLLDGSLKIRAKNAVAYSSPVTVKDSALRYHGTNTLEYSKATLSLSISFPYYSDPYAESDFSGRLTGFSISPLLGEDTVFPSSSSSSRGTESFTRSLSLSFSLPESMKSTWLSSLSLSSLTLKGSYSFQKENGAYALSSLTLPSYSVSMGGKIVESKWKGSAEGSGEPATDDRGDATEEKGGEETGENALHTLSVPLLWPLYEEKTATKKSSSPSPSSLTLSWDMSHSLSSDTSLNRSVKSGSDLSLSLSGRLTLEGRVGDSVTFRSSFSPSLSVRESGKSVNETMRESVKSTYVGDSDNTLTIPALGLVYSVSLRTWDVRTEVEKREGVSVGEKEDVKEFGWDRDSVKKHSLSLSRSLSTALGSFTLSYSQVLSPLKESITPSLSWSLGHFSSSVSTLFSEKDGRIGGDSASISLSVRYTCFSLSLTGRSDIGSGAARVADTFSAAIAASVTSTDRKYSLSLRSDYSYLSPDGSITNWISQVRATAKTPLLTFDGTWKADSDGVLEASRYSFTSSFDKVCMQLWKGRIYLSLSMKARLDLDMADTMRSRFSFEPSLVFSVAEFLDLSLSLRSENSRIGSYFTSDGFSIPLLTSDLLRSFDFRGDGRRNTAFILRSISLTMVHRMEDWDLNCKYSTDIVKSSTAKMNVYTLQPSLSVYLSWKTMPDLKAEENWSYVGGSGDGGRWEKK